MIIYLNVTVHALELVFSERYTVLRVRNIVIAVVIKVLFNYYVYYKIYFMGLQLEGDVPKPFGESLVDCMIIFNNMIKRILISPGISDYGWKLMILSSQGCNDKWKLCKGAVRCFPKHGKYISVIRLFVCL